jgi:hypothetical protein
MSDLETYITKNADKLRMLRDTLDDLLSLLDENSKRQKSTMTLGTPKRIGDYLVFPPFGNNEPKMFKLPSDNTGAKQFSREVQDWVLASGGTQGQAAAARKALNALGFYATSKRHTSGKSLDDLLNRINRD